MEIHTGYSRKRIMNQEKDPMNTALDRRRYDRLYFALSHGPVAKIANPLMESVFLARVMDISEGGMGFVMSKEKSLLIRLRQPLVLLEMKNLDGWFEGICGIGMQPVWRAQPANLDEMLIGCAFTALDNEMLERIRNIIRLCQY